MNRSQYKRYQMSTNHWVIIAGKRVFVEDMVKEVTRLLALFNRGAKR